MRLNTFLLYSFILLFSTLGLASEPNGEVRAKGSDFLEELLPKSPTLEEAKDLDTVIPTDTSESDLNSEQDFLDEIERDTTEGDDL
ncbi:MAG: hypothetical protein AAF518_14255, partial [Spirochaetota bacterium]